jgi:hypothetical protein
MYPMNPEQEIKLWKDVENVLYSIPRNLRTRNHANFVNEVTERILQLKSEKNNGKAH